jgi:hypothetical protein
LEKEMSRQIFLTMSLFFALIFSPANAQSDDEVSLFNISGKPVAYIALDDEMTIYLWTGKPVAYLQRDSDGYDVYGFNGNHLGWFLQGAIWDHGGGASCAVPRQRLLDRSAKLLKEDFWLIVTDTRSEDETEIRAESVFGREACASNQASDPAEVFGRGEDPDCP